jgi:hypothetical protein
VGQVVTQRRLRATHPVMQAEPWVEPPPTSAPERRRYARQLLREASAELARLRRTRGAYRKTARRVARARARLALAAALLAAALAEPASALEPIFDNGALGLALTASSASPTCADLDGDGDLDALIGDRFGVTQFFQNTGTAGAPAFAPPTGSIYGAFGIIDVGWNSAPRAADIDGDGDFDVLVGERYGSSFLFLNTGTTNAPSFAAPVADPFGLADVGLRAAPAFADIDGDGDLDVFVGEIGGSTLFFQNTGSAAAPAFAPPVTNAFGFADVGDRAVPSFADLDGDGDLDALVGEFYGSSFLLENTGTASAPAFAAPVADPLGLEPFASSVSPTFADVDGDGDLDAFVGEFYGATAFFENTGTSAAPAFASVATNPFGWAAVTDRVAPAFADIDGDGDLDAFAGNQQGHTLFLENVGTASAAAFAPPATNPFGLADVGSYASPRFADLDGDGDLDAFVGNLQGNTLFFQNLGNAGAPSFAAPSTSPFGLADVGNRATPFFADLDGDGDLDALVGNSLGNTLFFRNTGTANAPAFAAPSSNPFGLADVGVQAAPVLVDLEGDGDLDAVVGEAYGSLSLFRNTGTASAPAFAPPVVNPLGLFDLIQFAMPAFADLDGDGDLDAAPGGYLGRIFYLENRALDAAACTDGLDNDGDGAIDLGGDPGCANASDPNELGSVQCDNGLDDDGDGRIDWRAGGSGDANCSSLGDNREAADPPPACGLGPELLLLTPLLARRVRKAASKR